MFDIGKEFGPDGWFNIACQVRRGADPELTDLASTLRGKQPVPSEVRAYVADILEGKHKRKRGRKAPDAVEHGKKLLRRMALAERVRRWKRVFEKKVRQTQCLSRGPGQGRGRIWDFRERIGQILLST